MQMLCSNRFRLCLLVMVFAVWAWPVGAAEQLDKLLPDDANFVVSVNVKEILKSPLFTKNHQKQVEELLKMDVVQSVLKDTGFNPLEHLDRAVLVTCLSSFEEEGTRETAGPSAPGGPMLLLQGRFNPEKIQARIDQAAKDFPDQLKIHGIGKANVAEITMPGATVGTKYFAAVLDGTTVAVTPRREQMEDLLEKASGQRKTEFKNPALEKLLKGLDSKQAIQVVATADMILGSMNSVTNDGNKRVITVKHIRLRDSGIETLTGSGSVGEDIHGKVTLTAKDAEAAQKLQEMMEQGLGKIKAEGEQALTRADEGRELIPPILEALKTIKITAQDKAVTLEGHAAANAVGATIKGIFLRGGPQPPPAVEKDVDK